MTALEIPRGWIRDRERLTDEMRSCITAARPRAVNLSVPKHAITSACLRSLVYDAGLSGRALPIVFSDGSSPPHFPAGVLTEPGVTAGQATLRFGLMSFRHPEIDYLVDLYICRNLELATEQSMAAEEQYAHDRAVQVLGDPLLEGGGIIEVYHTGLEPMVVGFYRGVVEVLRSRVQRGLPRNLVIRPMLFAGTPTKEKLSSDSPGAQPGNYIAEAVWA